MRTLKEGEEFKRLLSRDPEVSRVMKRADIDACFDLEDHLRHVDTLFKRAFGGAKGGSRKITRKPGKPRKRP